MGRRSRFRILHRDGADHSADARQISSRIQWQRSWKLMNLATYSNYSPPLVLRGRVRVGVIAIASGQDPHPALPRSTRGGEILSRRSIIAVFLFLLTLFARQCLASDWTLTDSQFQTRPIVLQSID